MCSVYFIPQHCWICDSVKRLTFSNSNYNSHTGCHSNHRFIWIKSLFIQFFNTDRNFYTNLIMKRDLNFFLNFTLKLTYRLVILTYRLVILTYNLVILIYRLAILTYNLIILIYRINILTYILIISLSLTYY